MVLSASPCSIPSRTQCWICPSKTTWPTLCSADFAALICERISSHGTSSSTIRSMACTCPIIFSGGDANCQHPYIVSSLTPPIRLGVCLYYLRKMRFCQGRRKGFAFDQLQYDPFSRKPIGGTAAWLYRLFKKLYLQIFCVKTRIPDKKRTLFKRLMLLP